MAKDPAFLFYSSDFLVGTYTMTDAQVGQYIRLMCLQHQHGHLNSATFLSVMHGEMDAAVVSKFKQDKVGDYYNERLDAEASKRNSYAESRRRNLSNSPTHMPEHMQKHMEQHMHQHMENEIEIEIEDGIEDVNGDGNRYSIPPALTDVMAYCRKRSNSVDPEKFVDYYEARGWMLGKAKMKNWHSAIHYWEKNNFSNDSAKGGEPAPNWKVRPND